MFHLHIMEIICPKWLGSYDGSKYSNEIMGKWFGLYKRNIKIYLLFINHPAHPV